LVTPVLQSLLFMTCATPVNFMTTDTEHSYFLAVTMLYCTNSILCRSFFVAGPIACNRNPHLLRILQLHWAALPFDGLCKLTLSDSDSYKALILRSFYRFLKKIFKCGCSLTWWNYGDEAAHAASGGFKGGGWGGLPLSALEFFQ